MGNPDEIGENNNTKSDEGKESQGKGGDGGL